MATRTVHSFREALFKAFQKIGGVKHLSAWAEDNPTEFYKLAGRLLAQEKPEAPPIMQQTVRFTVASQASLFSDDSLDSG